MDRVNIKPTMSGIELIEGKSYIYSSIREVDITSIERKYRSQVMLIVTLKYVIQINLY